MKKNYLWFKRRVVVLTLLLTTVAVIYSCKKNMEQSDPKDLISQLQTTFNAQKVNGLSLAGKFANAGLNPNWKNAIIKKNRANKPLVIIPLQNTENFYAEMDVYYLRAV